MFTELTARALPCSLAIPAPQSSIRDEAPEVTGKEEAQ